MSTSMHTHVNRESAVRALWRADESKRVTGTAIQRIRLVEELWGSYTGPYSGYCACAVIAQALGHDLEHTANEQIYGIVGRGLDFDQNAIARLNDERSPEGGVRWTWDEIGDLLNIIWGTHLSKTRELANA